MNRLARSWLYVPGHQAERVAKALTCGADAVVVDLEDSVPPDRKQAARRALADAVASHEEGGPSLWVRCNAVTTPWGWHDLAVVRDLPLDGVRVPRCEDKATVQEMAEHVGLPLQLLLETARGLLRAEELSSCHPRVTGLGLGEADLAADLRVQGDVGLDWARGWVVAASRASGLRSPIQSVWTDVRDLDGLRASSERGRATGFVGRSIIHPSQIPVVHEAFTPQPEEVAAAHAVVQAADRAQAGGETAVLDDSGRFVDPAVVAQARVVLDLVGDHVPSPSPQQGADR